MPLFLSAWRYSLYRATDTAIADFHPFGDFLAAFIHSQGLFDIRSYVALLGYQMEETYWEYTQSPNSVLVSFVYSNLSFV